MRPGASTLALAGLMVSASACQLSPYTPPTRALGGGAPGPIRDGDTQVRAMFASPEHSKGFRGPAGGLAVRYGIRDEIALEGEAWYRYADHSSEDAGWEAPKREFPGRSFHIASGRVGFRYAYARHLSLGLGVGAGVVAPGGGFVGPDGEIAVGFYNRFAVPFLNVGLGFSVPFDTSSIQASPGDEGTVVNATMFPTGFLRGGIGAHFAPEKTVSGFVQFQYGTTFRLEEGPTDFDEVYGVGGGLIFRFPEGAPGEQG